ncbi:MAG: aspartate/glutamate racemase family protein [Alkalispirochaeta sp.]
MTRTVVIAGGVGPLAGVALHRQLVEMTGTDGRDQSHLPVLHISYSPIIPDRTEYLIGNDPRNPGEVLGRIVATTAGLTAVTMPSRPQAFDAVEPIRGVVGVPCNTFHAREIVEAFRHILAAEAPHLRFVDMVEHTVATVSEQIPPGAAIGVLSTTGTRRSGVWRDALQGAGYTVRQVPEHRQDELHDGIYNSRWGLKAVTPVTPEARSVVTAAAETLIGDGATAILVACTELPFVIPAGSYRNVPVIDPVKELARALVREAGGTVRGR